MSAWDTLSPDVESIVGHGERRQQDRKLSTAQKKERARQQARVRMTFDVPEWLRDEVLRVAEVEDTSASSMCAYLIAVGLRELHKGKIRLPKTGSDSPRFGFLVEVTEHDAGL